MKPEIRAQIRNHIQQIIDNPDDTDLEKTIDIIIELCRDTELPAGFATMEIASQVTLWHGAKLVAGIDRHLATPEVLSALARAEIEKVTA